MAMPWAKAWGSSLAIMATFFCVPKTSQKASRINLMSSSATYSNTSDGEYFIEPLFS